jgi:tetratricopeptide (TPR) repeat protein
MAITVPPRGSSTLNAQRSTLTSQRDRDVLRSFARRIDPSDAGAHNNLGVLYFHRGLYEEAAAEFTRALELDGRMVVAQRNLEIAYFNTGYYDRRVAELRERLRATPNDRDARWELGRTYALLGQTKDAITEFTALLEHHPRDVGALVQVGLAEKGSGDLERAQRWFQQALEVDPGNGAVHFYLGEVKYNRGLNDEALASLARSIEINADNPDAHYLMGFVLGDVGRHEDAQVATKKAIALNPALSRAHANLSLERDRPLTYEALLAARQERNEGRQLHVSPDRQLAHYSLGLAFRQKGYYNEALREYRLALDRGEERELVLQAMAEVHLLLHEGRTAASLYDRLVESRGDSPKLWNERGIGLHQDGRFVDAAESYRRAVAADGDYALAHNNLGVALFHAGDVDGSLEAFRRALKLRPEFIKARLNLALLLFKQKRHQLCLEAYRQVLRIEPEQPVAWNGIGLVLADLKQFEDARNAYTRAIDARPTYAEAHYNLSFVLANLGDYDGALRETKRALELDPYYVPQKFELAIDLEFENPDLTVTPDLGGEARAGTGLNEFTVDARELDQLFVELAPPPAKASGHATSYAAAAEHLAAGALDQAAVEINQALANGADRPTGLVLLGDVFSRQGALGEALERFREARLLDPSTIGALAGEVRALVALGRETEARPLAEQLVGSSPTDVDALLLAATAQAGTGDPAAALGTLDAARRAAPVRADVLKQIGDVSRSIGDSEGAIAAYRHALALDQDFAVVRYDLAAILDERGALREAEQELTAALDSVPTYVDATLALAALRRRLKRPAEAMAILIELLLRDPYHLDALTSLGETLFDTGQHDDAAVAFARVLRFDPEHVGALYFEGTLAAEQHRFRRAIACWDRVVELEPAGEYARRARRESRTALDLMQIFGDREVGDEAPAAVGGAR